MRLKLPVLAIGMTLWGEAPPIHAQDVLANLHACAAEQDDKRRLACYDSQLRQTPAESPQVQPAAPAPDELVSEERQFGMSEQLARQAAQTPHLTKLSARVVGVSYATHGEPVVKLENGQVWQVVEGEDPMQIDVGAVATIKAGVLGAYYFSMRKQSVRVKRIR
jgi:hypothetical protein